MIRIERKADGEVLAVHEWTPRKHRWKWFVGLMSAFTVLPIVFGGWEMGVILGLLVVYPIAAQCFNDTYVRVDMGKIRWWERPFPRWRMRKVKVEDVVEWAYGVTPKGKKTYITQYSVGVIRKNGKIMQAIRGEDELSQAQICADVLAKATGKKAVRRMSMRGPVEIRNQWWLVGIAMAVAAIAIVWILMGEQ